MDSFALFIINIIGITTNLFVVSVLLLAKTHTELSGTFYNKGKILLAIAPLALAINGIVMQIEGLEATVDLFSFPILITSILQASLYTFLFLYLFQSSAVSTRVILRHMLPTLLFIVTYSILVLFFPDKYVYSLQEYFENTDNLPLQLRFLFTLTYGVQIVLYIRLFRREKRIYCEKIDNYFANNESKHHRWCSHLFYTATSVGCLVLSYTFYPIPIFDAAITLILAVFSFYVAVRYINFQFRLIRIQPAIVEENEKSDNKTECESPYSSFNVLNAKIGVLLEERFPFYLQPSIVITDLATVLGVTKRTLSSHINTVYGINFNCWINSLRIEYAQKRLNEEFNTLTTLEQIAEECGFLTHASFSREFKKIAGVSPKIYRNQNNTYNTLVEK